MTAPTTNYFAAVPARALADEQLDSRHLWALSAIALHCRLDKGIGCYASHERLSKLARANYNRLSTTIGDLSRWGYLDQTRMGRSRIYRVLYTDADESVMRGEAADATPIAETDESPSAATLASANNSSPGRKLSDDERDAVAASVHLGARDSSPIVHMDFEQVTESVADPADNILGEALDKKFRKTEAGKREKKAQRVDASAFLDAVAQHLGRGEQTPGDAERLRALAQGGNLSQEQAAIASGSNLTLGAHG